MASIFLRLMSLSMSSKLLGMCIFPFLTYFDYAIICLCAIITYALNGKSLTIDNITCCR